MDLVRAAILGIVQGLTEFLPVSSSGHLILIPRLFNWPDQGLAFDVGLHVGTLVAVLAYFWRDWVRMTWSGLRDLRDHQLRMRLYRRESQILWLLALGSVPAAVVGLFLESWFEDNVRQPWLVAVTFAIFGVILLVADRVGSKVRPMESVGVRDAIVIGVAQAFALIPGVSRAGATMTAGLFRGLDRDSAARFAFLLGTPAFLGAALLKAKDLGSAPRSEWDQLAVGFVCSAIVGMLVIHALLGYLRRGSMAPFASYRWAVAAVTLTIAAIRVA